MPLRFKIIPLRFKIPGTDDRPSVGVGTLFFPDERTFRGVWSRPNVPALVFADSGYPGGSATSHQGPVASGVPIQLIFWGTFWESSEGAARYAMVVDRMRRVIESPYFSGLAQYGINPPSYRGAFIVTEPEAPATFDDRMEPVLDTIDKLVDDDKLPDPDDELIVYLVFMPKAFSPPSSANGAHTADYDYDFPDLDTHIYWAGWVRYFDPSLMGADQDPESTSRTGSHELVETLTDPEQNGWYIGSSPSTGELADGATSGSVRQTAFVNGARVSSYWSNFHNATIIPIDQDYAARINGAIDVETQYEVASGTFRPEPNASLCARAPACCFADRDYTWTVIGQDEVATLSLETQRYRSPVATWTVAGIIVVGSGPLTIPVSGVAYSGRTAVSVNKTVTINVVATATTLTLRTKRSELNFDLEIRCSVHDGSITGNLSIDVLATPAITVGFVGESLVLDPSYNDQMENCLKALTAEYNQNRLPGGRLPHGPVGPVEIDPRVLTVLPAWTRVSLYQNSVRAARAVRIGRELLAREAAEELRTSLLNYAPELALALNLER